MPDDDVPDWVEVVVDRMRERNTRPIDTEVLGPPRLAFAANPHLGDPGPLDPTPWMVAFPPRTYRPPDRPTYSPMEMLLIANLLDHQVARRYPWQISEEEIAVVNQAAQAFRETVESYADAWRKAYQQISYATERMIEMFPEQEDPEEKSPRERALPKPSTTPPFWANTPNRRRRR